MCVAGASWARTELLAKRPDAKLRVYAVWQPILLSDFRVTWREAMLQDSRVTHFWDVDKVLAKWFAEFSDLPPEDGVRPDAWDLIYMFGPRAQWGATLDPPAAWSGPIVEAGPKLVERIDSELGSKN